MEITLKDMVIKLSDEQEDRKKFQELTRVILRYLTTKKIKDFPLFKKRTGIEYQTFYESLDFPKEMKDDLLDNDEYLELVISEAKKFRR
jgi:hypothetical protein